MDQSKSDDVDLTFKEKKDWVEMEVKEKSKKKEHKVSSVAPVPKELIVDTHKKKTSVSDSDSDSPIVSDSGSSSDSLSGYDSDSLAEGSETTSRKKTKKFRGGLPPGIQLSPMPLSEPGMLCSVWVQRETNPPRGPCPPGMMPPPHFFGGRPGGPPPPPGLDPRGPPPPPPGPGPRRLPAVLAPRGPLPPLGPQSWQMGAYALIVRLRTERAFDQFDGIPPNIVTGSIVVQSPLIRKLLKSALAGYPKLDLDVPKLIFGYPFGPIFHRWDAIQAAVMGENDEVTRKHCRRVQNSGNNCPWIREITNAYPFGPFRDPPTAILLKCEFVHWDGKQFGRVPFDIDIHPYVGTKPPVGLKVRPLEYLPDKLNVERLLRRRAFRFQAFSHADYMAYKGMALDVDYKPFYVDSRVVIDAAAYYQNNPSRSESYPMASMKSRDDGLGKDQVNLPAGQLPGYKPLGRDQLLICNPRVAGYSLKDRQWLEFYIDQLEEIEWNTTAFDNLVMSDAIKKSLLAICKAQCKSGNSFDDIIKGKGKGMIVHLNGPSGVGKTLTAESIAETTEVPLITITAGDLASLDQLRELLTKNVALAKTWGAVLLIDDFDVLVERRGDMDGYMERQIISAVLPYLESYEGLMFLTTSRVREFDPSLESRVHVRIEYPSLDQKSRRQIWKNFLGRMNSESWNVSEVDLDVLSQREMDGRAIKNAMKTAVLLAESERKPLSTLQIHTVLDLGKQ